MCGVKNNSADSKSGKTKFLVGARLIFAGASLFLKLTKMLSFWKFICLRFWVLWYAVSLPGCDPDVQHSEIVWFSLCGFGGLMVVLERNNARRGWETAHWGSWLGSWGACAASKSGSTMTYLGCWPLPKIISLFYQSIDHMKITAFIAPKKTAQ